ncbi:tetratricopeptide repeat protein [Millionella massiliensis]|uniref:tetratricopeptide repeat protein n=1 Tax=Millionella massiliensis TaxID=1871023 RepID=UPI0008D9CEC8|nr:tetratricopeptide repeat protein [Millionella massiliensis]
MKKHLAALLLLLSVTLFGVGEASAQLNKPYFFYKGRELILEEKFREAIEMLNLLLRTETKEYEGYFLRGVAKYNLDDLLGAEADFSSAIAVNPVYTMAYQYRAITRSRLGNYSDALKDYQHAVELRPNLSATYYSRGVTYFLSQQFEKAVDDFSRYLRHSPTDVNALTNRGTCYLYLKDTVQAYADFNRAVEINPYVADGYMRRGLLEVAQSKNDEGIRDLTEALKIDSTQSIAYFYRAYAYVNKNQPMQALKDFDQAIRYDSTNSVTYFNRALLRSQIGDYNRAIEDYDRVALYNPGNVLVFYNRATVKIQVGDYPGAIEDYSRAIELYPDFANAYLYRSQLKAALRDFKGAEADRKVAETKIEEYRRKLSDSTFTSFADTSRQFDKLLSFDADFGNNELRSMRGDIRRDVRLMPVFRITIVEPDTTERYNPRDYRNARLDTYLQLLATSSTARSADRLGFRFDLTGTPAAASLPVDSVASWDAANLTPTSWQDNFLKGITQTLLRQYASGLSYYRRAARVESDNPLIYLNRGAAQAEMIEFIASLEGNSVMQQVSIQTDDPAARLLQNRGQRTYDYSEAIADTRKAIELMPELPQAYFNLGNMLCLSGDLPGAFEQYTKAIERFPYLAEAYYNRGLVQIFMKDTEKGCLDLSKAGELGLSEAYEVLKRFCIKTR